MRIATISLIILAACPATTFAASNAQDVTFILAPPDKPAGYRVGERIEINASISAEHTGYCLIESGGALRNRNFRDSEDDFRVELASGAEADHGVAYDPYFDETEIALVIVRFTVSTT